MDIFVVVVVLALISTIAALGLGLMVMSGGGDLDKEVSTPLMWLRVGLQGLTIVLLVIAIFLR